MRPGTREGLSLDKSGTYYISSYQIKVDRALHLKKGSNHLHGMLPFFRQSPGTTLTEAAGLQVAAATVKAGPGRVQPVAGLIVVRAVYMQGRLVKLHSLNAALYL